MTLCLTAVPALAAVFLDGGLMLADAVSLAAAIAAALAAAVTLANNYASLTSANPTGVTSAVTDAQMLPRSTATTTMSLPIPSLSTSRPRPAISQISRNIWDTSR
jgi:hypothetical protein